MNARGSALLVLLVLIAAACRVSGDSTPAPLDTATETCRSCRMPVSDPHLAAQLLQPGEEAAFFDDIGCLRDFLRDGGDLPAGTIAYVADHRTRTWVPAAEAVYTRMPSRETPMGSHLVAHADATSRGADADAAGGTAVSAAELFGPPGPPGGRP